MHIEFEKWQACHNDFIVIHLPRSQSSLIESFKRQAPKLCSKKGDGIAADGILILLSDTKESIPSELVVINQDGSLAAHCGNGIRCAALSVYRRQVAQAKTWAADTQDIHLGLRIGTNTIVSQFLSRKNALPLVKVSMGRPSLDSECEGYAAGLDFIKQKLSELNLKSLGSQVHLANIFNKHALFFVDEKDKVHFEKVGQALQNSTQWDGINVSFVMPKEVTSKDKELCLSQLGQDLGELYSVLVWERGVGPTAACGSAATVIGSKVSREGFIESLQWVAIDMPGGRLYARQQSLEDEAELCGPGEFVFTGTLEL